MNTCQPGKDQIIMVCAAAGDYAKININNPCTFN